jgi:hypothetical protein
MTPTIEDVLKKYIYKNIEGFGDGLTVAGAEAAMTEYASLNRQGWTRVEDGLPEIGSSVLTFPHFKVLPFGTTEEDKIGNECDNDFWEWYGDDDSGGARLARPYPTHWMPLPNKPI